MPPVDVIQPVPPHEPAPVTEGLPWAVKLGTIILFFLGLVPALILGSRGYAFRKARRRSTEWKAQAWDLEQRVRRRV